MTNTIDFNLDQEVKFSFKRFMKFVGPGLLVSIAYLDPGNLAGDIDAGLTGKYSLLWGLLWSTVLGYFFQIYAIQLGLTTGKDLSNLGRKYFTKKTSILLWIMAEIAIIGSDIQEVLGTAVALNILFELPLWIGVLLAIMSTMLILLIKVYGMTIIEIIFAVLIGVMAICFFINLSLIDANGADIVVGTLLPNIPAGSALSLVGLIGAVLMPHNLYLHSSLVHEKKIDKFDSYRVREGMYYFKMETGGSLILSFFINLAVISTFAVFSENYSDLGLDSAATTLEDNIGSQAKYIWGIGLLAAGQASTITGTLAGQYIMEGYVKIKVSKFKRALVTRLIAILPSLLMAIVSNPDDWNNNLNVLQAIQLPFAVIPLLKFCMNKYLMRQYQMSKITFLILSSLSAGIVVANYYSIFADVDEVDFSSPWTYIYVIVGLAYFGFMIMVVREPLEPESIDQIKQQMTQQYQLIEYRDTYNHQVDEKNEASLVSQQMNDQKVYRPGNNM